MLWTQRLVSAGSGCGCEQQQSAEESATILLVEDEPSVRALLGRVLRSRGYSVLEASDGAEAIQMAQRTPRPFHLLLTDVVMPKLSGPEVAARLIACGQAQRVIFMTGYADLAPEIWQQFTVLHKPFSPSALAEAVQSALAR